MHTQIKELEFVDWFYYFMTDLDNLFSELTELGVIDQSEFPRISVFYLHEMFWSSNVSIATRDCQTQEEYDQVIKQITEQQLKEKVLSILNKKLDIAAVVNTMENLNINFHIY